MHCHYPMHLVAAAPKRDGEWTTAVAAEALRERAARPDWLERLRAGAIDELDGLINYRPDQWRVSLDKLLEGDVRGVFSVLYEPFAEFDLDEPYGAPPERGYFDDLIGRLDGVEAELHELDPDGERHHVVHTAGDLDAALAADKVAFMHCVEGGFHLGDTPEHITANVAELARRGVAYIALAHLFYRQVATNAPALPFLQTDERYDELFPQPAGTGLTELGEAAVRAMVANGVLIDLSHMSTAAIRETLELLDRIDPAGTVPVIASHAGYRFGHQEYLLDDATLAAIARRNGVVGLILAQYQLNDGLQHGHVHRFAKSKDIIFRHVDKIAEQTGGYEHLGIGSDFDGFIKPTMAGLESCADMPRLEDALREHLAATPGAAEKVTNGNVVRVLHDGWGVPVG
jgi:microsomal dipeptidase-like Zn-dependent dipeptidase